MALKVLLFCNLIPFKEGAFEAFLEGLGAALCAAGGTLHCVLAGPPIEAVAERFRKAGTTWEVLDGWATPDDEKIRPWRLFYQGRRVVQRVRPSVVDFHFCNELPAATLILCSRLLSKTPIQWFWHQHQQIDVPSGGIKSLLNRIRLLAMTGCRFIALSESGRSSLLLRCVRSEAASVIPNGVPDVDVQDGTRKRLREQLQVGVEDVVVLCVGSFIQRKRVDLAIKAVARCRRPEVVSQGARGGERGRVHLVLVGDGPLRGELEQRAADGGQGAEGVLPTYVHFLGIRNDVAELMSASDIALLCSDREASPLFLIEAARSGLPAVTTDAGASREIVLDGETGFVVPVGDLESIVRRLDKLVENMQMHDLMGSVARLQWEGQYSLQRMVVAHLEVYRSWLGA